MSAPRLLLLTVPLALSSAVAACSGSGTDTGTGGADTGSGASPSTGGDSSGTGATSSDGGSGTGASNAGGSGGTGVVTPTRPPGTDHYDCTPASGTIPGLELAVVASGFDRPVLVTHAPNDTSRLFVVEQGGVIKIVKGTTTEAEAFLDISDKVAFSGETWDERGLLGLAFHPDYAANGLFYVHYSAGNDTITTGAPVDARDTTIEEYEVSGADADLANEASARTVFTATQPNFNHNGGTITFGPDGYLYVFLGDGGGAGNQYGNAQNLTSPLGKVLRFDPTGAAAGDYTAPTSGNLIDDEPTALPIIWDYGLRNPFRANFDGCTGDLYIADVGQADWEEVNVEAPGDGRRNYGWSTMEGTHCFEPATGCDQTGLTLPVAEYTTESAIIGGAVYRGTAIPALRGMYFFGDYFGSIRTFAYDGTMGMQTVTDRTDAIQPGVLTSIQNDAAGEIYATTFGGALVKLQAEN